MHDDDDNDVMMVIKYKMRLLVRHVAHTGLRMFASFD